MAHLGSSPREHAGGVERPQRPQHLRRLWEARGPRTRRCVPAARLSANWGFKGVACTGVHLALVLGGTAVALTRRELLRERMRRCSGPGSFRRSSQSRAADKPSG